MKYEKDSFLVVPNKHTLFGLDPITQTLYHWLCDYADVKGVCFPSRSTLARASGCSIKSIDRAIEKLESLGMLVKSNRLNEKGELTSNRYQLMLVKGGSVLGTLGSDSQSLPLATVGRTELNPVLTQPREYIYIESEKPKKEKTNLDGFGEWWELYPKKLNKAGASAEWRKLSKEEQELATKDVLTRRWEDPKYAPMPANYLSQRRWEDEGIKHKPVPSFGRKK